MSQSIIFLTIAIISAIGLDYVLILRLNVYRRLREEQEKAGIPISKLNLIRQAFWWAEIQGFKFSAIAWFKGILSTPIPYIIVLILVGIIQLRLQLWLAGAICTGLGLIILAVSLRLVNGNIATSEVINVEPMIVDASVFKFGSLIKTILWVMTVALLAASIFFIRYDLKTTTTDRVAAGAWVASMILGMILVLQEKLIPSNLFIKIKENRIELVSVLIIVSLAFAIRIYDLSEHPYPWSGDEMSIGIQARQILNGEITNLFDVGWALQPNWSFLPTALSLKLFGGNIVAIRLVSVVAGTLAVLFTYLTARELFNPLIGLMAGAFLATLPYNVHFSRIGVGNIMDSFMSALVFWLIAKIDKKKKDPRLYYVAGAIGGLCIYTYIGTRLVPLLAIFFLLVIVILQKNYQPAYWRNFFVFIIGLTISAAPEIVFLAENPNNFMGRMKVEGIFINGWMTQQIEQTGRGTFEILFGKFLDTSMAFIASPAMGMFYNSPKPYLTILGSVFLLIGMIYCMVNLSKISNFIMLSWFWVVIVLGGVFTRPPVHTRLLMTSPAMAIMMGLGIFVFIKYLQKFNGISKKMELIIMICISCIITSQQIYFYMVEYRNNVYFQDVNGEFAMEAGVIAGKLGQEYQVFILGEPRLDSNFPTLSFLVPDNRRADINTETYEVFNLPPNQSAVFFATLNNHELLGEIMADYPSGSFFTLYRTANPKEILFEYFILNK